MGDNWVRNTVSVFLMGIGILIIAIGFIAGIGLGKDAYGDFSLAVALYWWLSALAAGFLFIGLSEVVHLLQKLLDRSAGAAPFQAVQVSDGRMPAAIPTAAGTARAEGVTGSYSASADQAQPAVPGETVVQHANPARGVEQFKGLTILLDGRKIKGAFRFGPELLQIVSQSKGTRKLAFKTHNLYDYDRIVKRIRREA